MAWPKESVGRSAGESGAETQRRLAAGEVGSGFGEGALRLKGWRKAG